MDHAWNGVEVIFVYISDLCFQVYLLCIRLLLCVAYFQEAGAKKSLNINHETLILLMF